MTESEQPVSVSVTVMLQMLFSSQTKWTRWTRWRHSPALIFYLCSLAVAHTQDTHPHSTEKPLIQCYKCKEPCKGEVLRVQNKHFHLKCFTCKGTATRRDRDKTLCAQIFGAELLFHAYNSLVIGLSRNSCQRTIITRWLMNKWCVYDLRMNPPTAWTSQFSFFPKEKMWELCENVQPKTWGLILPC